ncbi:IS21 family transposase [archaeon]|jgi:hypothetical protein|nr:IS21 family transposase [archaeon]
MSCTDQQIKMLKRYYNMKYNQEQSAAKVGISVKTARKYLKSGKLPSELKRVRDWKTRKDPFEGEELYIENLIKESPELEAKTVMEELIRNYPKKYNIKQLRTLQRRIRDLKAEYGEGKEVMFLQRYKPGRQSQSDFTSMNSHEVKIGGKIFHHLLFHFSLSYSGWSDVYICDSESFANLAKGYERAIYKLGGVAGEHRTDNLTAAWIWKKGECRINKDWESLTEHYRVNPTHNNPSISHENGIIEKRHDVLKRSINQALLLRGSRDFRDLEEYENFLRDFINKKNILRIKAIEEEMKFLKPLPDKKWIQPKIYPVKVRKTSLVHIKGASYSVPSRLIGYTLRAYVYYDRIEFFYGEKFVEEVNILPKGKTNVDYRHLIDSLIKKPGAFENYKHMESFFPDIVFKKTYELLQNKIKSGTKEYLKILKLAKLNGEETVKTALELVLEENEIPSESFLKELLEVPIKIPEVTVFSPDLSEYDKLCFIGGHKS